ncbi:MAG: M16 family metallopeptidase [Actinomycetota bacterium]
MTGIATAVAEVATVVRGTVAVVTATAATAGTLGSKRKRAHRRGEQENMGYDRTVLPSGIRVVSERLPGQRSVSLGAWVGTGSRDEPAELNGATHFLEHLLFKGTPTRTAFEIAQSFDAIGGDINAFTSREFTCFHARALAGDLAFSLETIADLVQNASLVPEDVEAERSVVLEEIAMHEDTPDDIVFDVFHETIWPQHPLGRRVQGMPEAIEAMSRDAIAGFFHRYYTADNIVLAASGDVEHDRIVELAAAAFGAQATPRPLRAPGAVPLTTGSLFVSEREIEQAHLVYGTQGIPRADDRRWSLGLLNVVLGGGMSSRLFQEIRERRGLAYAVSSGHQGYTETGMFNIYAGCSTQNVGEVLAIIRDQVEAISAEGITDEELARAKGHVGGSLVLSMEEPGAVMSHLGKSELCLGEILSVEEMIARVEAVTQDDVARTARAVLGGSPWSLVVLGPALETDVSSFVGAAA